MFDSQTEACRRAIVEDIDGVAIEPDHLGEAVDRLGHLLEGVLGAGRHVGFAETGQVGSDDMEAVGQARDQITEHVTCAGEAVKQQQLGSAERACRTIENVETVHVGDAVFDVGHAVLLLPHRQSLIIWAATPGTSGATTSGWGKA